MIVNKVITEANENLEYVYLNNGYPIETIKELFFNDNNIPVDKLKDYILMNYVENLLLDWQCKFDHNKAIVERIEWPKNSNKTIHTWEQGCFDGYSQISWNIGSSIDGQVYEDEFNIFIFLANSYGGLATVINKETYEIQFLGIGEDDGSWFITDSLWVTKEFAHYKQKLLSEISELHIENFNHQLVIEKIFKMKEFNIIPMDRWTKF